MKTQIAYCSACDRDVHIVVTDEPSQDGHANLHESEVVCLEVGQSCTGNLCPIGAAPAVVMASRLVHSGLPMTGERVTAHCPGCERRTSHIFIPPALSSCEECGTTRPRKDVVA
jgi:hypothetical protein